MKLFTFLITFLLIFPSPALAKESCSHSPSSFSCVEYVRNYDADTITVNIPAIHPLLGNKISIRVAGVDSPELRSKKACEKQLAYEARDYVRDILTKANSIDLKNLERGKYFRIVAEVYIDGVSLANMLLDQGYAYPYDGGKKPAIEWCK
ncbi:MAG: thermonuclease family protein [Oligoflexales bacterium]